jgi:hypothetical protein
VDAKVPRLISLGQGGRLGRSLELSGDYMTVGRSASNDLLLSDLSVSRMHAAISIDDHGGVRVKDLGSTAGTTVNGRRVTTSTALQPGDVVAFGGARFEFDGTNERPDATALLPIQRDSHDGGRAAGIQGRYDIESQHGGNISNVAGDQYTSYVQHVRRERESFLREVAATRTKARWLIWAGAFVAIVGLILFGGSVIQFLDYIFGTIKRRTPTDPLTPIPDYIMSPIAFVGFAMWTVGIILMIIGIILHVVATSRRKRVDRELPMPRPGRTNS